MVEAHDEAGLRVDKVRVLGGFRQRDEFDVIAADLTGEGAEIGRGGDDVQRGRRGGRQPEGQREQKEKRKE